MAERLFHKMENRLLPDEEVAFINQKVTEFSNRRPKSFTRRCFILTAFVLFTVALTVLAIALIRHVELDRTRANEISTASFERCGNQSTKACIQGISCFYLKIRLFCYQSESGSEFDQARCSASCSGFEKCEFNLYFF